MLVRAIFADWLMSALGGKLTLSAREDIGSHMRQYDDQPTDRSLIDLRDRRVQLSIEISLLKDADHPDADSANASRTHGSFNVALKP